MKSKILVLCLLASPALHAADPMFDPMFDPVIDDASREWCYAAQSTLVIGLPFVPEPVQVTYDGSIYTRYAEMGLFYGKPLTPVMARNKTFLEGWIPVVQYGWKDGVVDYHLEIFSAELPELGRANLVQFVKMTMRNGGKSPAEGVVAAAIRGSAEFFRKGSPKQPVAPTTRFAMVNGGLSRAGKIVYLFSPGAETLAVPDAPCTGPYTARDHHITDRAATGFALYRRILQPGETFEAVFKMPRVPLKNADQIAAVAAADYSREREKTVAYWNDVFGDFRFEIPEKRVDDSYRAGLVHLMLATRANNDGTGRRQGSGLPYDALFLNDYIDMVQAYDTAGLYRFAEPNVDWLLEKQYPSGMFIDVHNRGNDRIVTSHGQGLFELAYHLIMTRDKKYGRKTYPAICKGAEWIVQEHRTNNRYGLLRVSVPYDAPMLNGHFTCHNLFALLALRASIRAARIMGETEDAEAWAEAEASYREAILKAIDTSFRKDGYIRSGLYDWYAGKTQKGRENEYPNQDWENMLLVYPAELLSPDDSRLLETLATIRARRYREGVMTYRNGMHIHQYVTLNMTQQYRAIGDQKYALLDLYHVLLHSGSTHEGFENQVVPWSTRTPSPGRPQPHAWCAAKIALFIRDMLVCEYGGETGLVQDQRDLYLYSLISPAWIQSGKKVAIHNAPTEMGKISSTLSFTKDGAQLTVRSDFHHPPRTIALRIPYTVVLDKFESNVERSFEKDGVLFFTPDVTAVTLKWHERPGINDSNYQDILHEYRSEYGFVEDGDYESAKPGKPFLRDDEKNHLAEPLSFDLVRRAFLQEYKRRFEQYKADGGEPYPVEPPKLLTSEERKAAFERIFAPAACGIAVGKRVSASASLPDHPPELAVDGMANQPSSSWQTDPYPAWLKIDLEKPVKIDHVQVFPFWGKRRYYRYTVEVSMDGKTWRQVVDMSENTRSATAKGDDHRFDPVEARYIRVNMLYHNLNLGVHLVEVRVFGAK